MPWAGRERSARRGMAGAMRGLLPVVLALVWRALLGGLMLAAAQAQAQPSRPSALVLDGQPWPAEATVRHLRWLEDPDGSMTLTQVEAAAAAGAFEPLQRSLSLGYTQATVWLRLLVRREPQAPSLWWLQVPRGYLDSVELFHIRPGGEQEPVRQAGDRVAARGALPLQVPSFELLLDEPGDHVLLLRVRTRSAMDVPVTLATRDGAMAVVGRSALGAGALVGASLLLTVAALLGFVGTRDRVYLVFAAFVAVDALLWVAVGGWLHQLLAHAPGRADQVIAVAIPVASACGLLLQWSLFGVPRAAPRLWRWGIGLAGGFLALALLQLLMPSLALTPWVLRLLLPSVAMTGWAAAQVWRGADAVQRGVTLLLLLAAGCSGLRALALLGWIGPSAWSEAAFGLSHLLQVLVGVFHLVHRAVDANRRERLAEARAAQAEERHRAEQTLREEKSALLSMIAHEVRTPLTVIDAAMQSLALLDEPMPQERRRRHERIGRALQRMGSLIDLVVSRDRLEVGEWSQQLETVRPSALTAEVVRELGEEAQQRVDVACGEVLPAVTADVRMLSLALANLVDNALKYSPPRLPVQVDVRALRWQGQDGVVWAVLDQGPGIPEADREKVFRKYFRGGEGSDAPGMGLGLYLVRQIAERHGGMVHVLPQAPGAVGAGLQFWLPVKPPGSVPVED